MFSGEVVRQLGLVAAKHNIEPAALEAVADVESAGIPFWHVNGMSVPPARPERHYFYKLLGPGPKRDQAVRLGLAAPSPGPAPASYAAVYARIEQMKRIDETAALESCSWGIGQVMGQWARALGYSSVQECVSSCYSVAGQAELMERFIEHNGLAPYLRSHNWAAFAQRYNGAGYRRNSYDVKLRRAYASYSRQPPVVIPTALRPTTVDPAVQAVQQKLNGAGIPVTVDGKKGPETVQAVTEFQNDNGLVPDGTVGVNTRDALDNAVKQADSATGDKALVAGSGAAGVDVAVDKINESTQSLGWLSMGGGHAIEYLLLALTCLTVVLVMYGLYKKFRTP